MYGIYKYALEANEDTTIMLPKGARVLTVQTQRGEPQLWILINKDGARIQNRTFRIVGTGRPIEDPNTMRYVGTFQLLGEP